MLYNGQCPYASCPAFYEEDGSFVQVEQGTESDDNEEEELRIRKIAARSGTSTLLFEPRDIDYVENHIWPKAMFKHE